MKTLSKAILISSCLVLASFSAQAGGDKKKQAVEKCDFHKVKSMTKKQIRFCAKNAKRKDQKNWVDWEAMDKW